MTVLRFDHFKMKGLPFLKEAMLLLTLFGFVLLINLPIISFDMMYPEQPLIYAANHLLHSLKDLLAIYLHPKMFHLSILFFRPSGHFFLYQLLEPLLGWHNTKALILVNLGFLALSGYFMLKLYALLFPQFKMGGYLALGLYFMHPALMLSRLIILHFEFAYVLFTVLSLYCFVLFCRQRTENFYYLAASLFFYVIAVTFKEPALFLGPVLIAYLLFSRYQGQNFSSYVAALFKTLKTRELLLLLLIMTLCLGLYLSLQWPSLQHPLRKGLNLVLVFNAFKKLMSTAFGLQGLFFPPPVWRNVIFPDASRFILGFFGLLAVASPLMLFSKRGVTPHFYFEYKKSLAFLFLTSGLFLLLPVFWGWGLPWHLSLSLVFFSMIMGFGAELLGRSLLKSKMLASLVCFFVAFGIGLMSIQVNQENIDYLVAQQGFPLAVGRNAVFHPPKLQAHLNANSVLVVEDSLIHDAYLLGASIYPYYFSLKLNSPNLDADEKQYQQAREAMFIRQQPVYNGTLFKWAYLMPELQEEVYPFEINHMDAVPDLVLYDWLQHKDNIFCVGYDKQANWHDRSADFKKNLVREMKRRQMMVHSYESFPATVFDRPVAKVLTLPVPLPQLCQLDCDQNKQCKGFTYLKLQKEKTLIHECLFYNALAATNPIFCAACEGYLKK